MYNLNEFEKLVESGHLRKAVSGPLVLYTYTEKSTFDRAWETKYTRRCSRYNSSKLRQAN